MGWIRIVLCLSLAACASSGTGAATDAAGDRAAALPAAVTDMQGGSHAVAARSGEKPLVLVFWQVWCKSCAEEAPALALAALQNRGTVEFLGVVPGSDELVDDDRVRETAQAWGMPYPSVRDRDLALTKSLGIEGTPTIVVLGDGGDVLYRGTNPPPRWNAFRN